MKQLQMCINFSGPVISFFIRFFSLITLDLYCMKYTNIDNWGPCYCKLFFDPNSDTLTGSITDIWMWTSSTGVTLHQFQHWLCNIDFTKLFKVRWFCNTCRWFLYHIQVIYLQMQVIFVPHAGDLVHPNPCPTAPMCPRSPNGPGSRYWWERMGSAGGRKLLQKYLTFKIQQLKIQTFKNQKFRNLNKLNLNLEALKS